MDSIIYEQRLLVFLETEPQSNKYRQVILNEEQFKKLTDNLGTFTGKVEGDAEEVLIEESEEIYTLPDLQSHT